MALRLFVLGVFGMLASAWVAGRQIVATEDALGTVLRCGIGAAVGAVVHLALKRSLIRGLSEGAILTGSLVGLAIAVPMLGFAASPPWLAFGLRFTIASAVMIMLGVVLGAFVADRSKH